MSSGSSAPDDERAGVTTNVETLNYQGLWDQSKGAPFIERLNSIWQLLKEKLVELYARNLVSQGDYRFVPRGRFTYAFDTRQYADDVFDYNTMIDDRVIFVAGVSERVPEKRDPYKMRGSLSQREFGSTPLEFAFDRGHFIAHAIGGHEDMGLFPQRRDINQGRSEAGVMYAAMERYCRERPGTFVFSRPIYGDNTGHPFWVEYGVLKDDREFWVEIFPNRYSFTPFLGLEMAPEWYRKWVERDRLAVERGQKRREMRKEPERLAKRATNTSAGPTEA